MPARVVLLTAVSIAAFGQISHFTRHEIRNLGKERIVGAALDGERLVTWGNRILTWDLPQGRMQPGRDRLHPALRQIPSQNAVAPRHQALAIERCAHDALFAQIANLMPRKVRDLTERSNGNSSEENHSGRHRDNAIL